MKRFSVAMAALVMAGCGWRNTNPPASVSELRPDVAAPVRWSSDEVPASQNGWDLAMRASSEVPGGISGSAPGRYTPSQRQVELIDAAESRLVEGGKAVDEPTAEALLRDYEPALSTIFLAVARPRWSAPAPPDDQVPNLEREMAAPTAPRQFAAWKALCKAALLRAATQLRAGRHENAASDLLLAHGMGRRLVESHGMVMQLLTGFSMQEGADRAIQRLSRDPSWSSSDLRRILAAIPDTRTGVDLAASMRTEFDSDFLHLIAGVAGTGRELDLLLGYGVDGPLEKVLRGHPQVLDRHETIQRASALYCQVVENATCLWSQRRQVYPSFAAMASEWPKGIIVSGDTPLDANSIEQARKVLAPVKNPMGKLLSAIMVPVFEEAQVSDRRALADLRATRMILACALFRRQTGREPARLKEIVGPGLLQALPDDPFGNGPFRYDAKRRLVWSVGPNGKDDGGHDTPGRFVPTSKDFVWPSDGAFPRT